MSQTKSWKTLQMVKARVDLALGEDQALKRYEHAFKKEFHRFKWKSLTIDHVLQNLRRADIVLGADFHAHSLSQKNHFQLLNRLQKQGCSLVVGIEMVESRYQSVLEDYLEGRIGEARFLRDVHWDKHWGFPWNSYASIFRFVKENKIPVVALNRYYRNRSLHSLHQRDRHAGRIIAQTLKQYPGHLIYCLFGELHLSKPHLPFEITSFEKRPVNMVRILQDLETIPQSNRYFMSPGGDICTRTGAPWHRWNSYLSFLDDQDLVLS